MRWRGTSTHLKSESHLPLAVQLQQIRENSERYLPPDKLAVHERAIAHLRAQDTAQRVLQPGARTPDFTLPDQQGRELNSRNLLGKGKLIILFFRGRWCPYCVTQLESMQFMLPGITAKDASLVAISPQKVHQNFLTADQHKLTFPLLSDRGNTVASRFRVNYQVPPEQLELYRSVFINLSHLNDDAPDSLPIAATFLVSNQGTVERAFADEDFRHRPEPADLLALL
ncbi:MAG: peroxiredoxin family protein [Acidobacteriaceae bacterium]